ncbi:hypothetical protein ACQGFJ_32565 [Rhodococcus sp. 3.70]
MSVGVEAWSRFGWFGRAFRIFGGGWVRQLVDHVEPASTAFGEFEQVTASLDKVFSNGNGAIVQRRQLARRSRVADVIDECARRTFEGCSSQGVSEL